MNIRDWEFFESEVVSAQFQITDAGPLIGPINAFKITRDKELQLVLTTRSPTSASPRKPPLPANSVTIASGKVHFQHRYGTSAVVAEGISSRGSTTEFRRIDEPASSAETCETSHISTLRWSREDAHPTTYVIEWIENLSSPFIWPHHQKNSETTETHRTFSFENEQLVIPSTRRRLGDHRSCARLTIGCWTVIIGKSNATPMHIQNPGFIIYMNAPDQETRKKIRGCISFLLGDFLISLGSTSFDKSWDPTSFCAESGHALVEQAIQISGTPPTPLGTRYEHEIDAEMLSSMCSRLFENYDRYHLRTVFWNYWHAKAAPVHMAAAHFGAALEGLQSNFSKQNSATNSPFIVSDHESWQRLSKELSQQIEASGCSAEEKRLLNNKITGLNSLPISLKSEKFFSSLDLQISELEKKVWQHRNRAAHGGAIANEHAITAIRENKVLMTLLHRTILAICSINRHYFDYYNLGRPINPLAKPVTRDT